MSRKIPGVGEIWESKSWGKVVVLALPMSWDEYTPSSQCSQVYSCLDEDGYTRDLDISDFHHYISESKANINELFEGKND